MFGFDVFVAFLEVAHRDIADAQAATCSLVGVGRTDTFQGRADLHLAESLLVGCIQNTMRWQNEMCLVGNHQALCEVDASRSEVVDFVFQNLRIDDDAVANHVDTFIIKRS